MTKQIPQGYKQTKVGIIPEDWEVVKFGTIAKFFGGGTPSTQNLEFWKGNIPWISSSDLIEDNIRYINTTRFITQEAINNSATKIIPENSILIVSRVGVGKIAVNRQALCTSQDFQSAVLEVGNNYFFSYLLQLKTKKLIELNQGTSIKGLIKDDLSSLLVENPPLKEQDKIAEILSTWDDVITKQEQLIEQKKAFKKGIMQQVFSQKIRFKDDDGADYPAWEEKKLGTLNIYIADGNYGEMYPKSNELLSEGVPFIRANNFQNLRLMWNDMKFISPLLHKKLISGHIKTHDILVTTRGDIGMLSYVTKDFSNSNINAQICLLRCISGVFSKYLLYFLSSSYGVTQFKALQTGSALKQLPKGNLSKLFIKLPCLEEQTKIADFLTIIDEEIEKLSEELGQMKLQKQGLMQRLLTGSVRVVI